MQLKQYFENVHSDKQQQQQSYIAHCWWKVLERMRRGSRGKCRERGSREKGRK